MFRRRLGSEPPAPPLSIETRADLDAADEEHVLDYCNTMRALLGWNRIDRVTGPPVEVPRRSKERDR